MGLNKNNNSRIIYRIAQSNLTAKKMSSLIAMLTIFLAITLVSTLSLFIMGTQTAEQNILDKMQHVMYMNVTEDQMQSITADEKTEICVPYKHYEKDFEVDGVKYNLYYFESYADKIRTYVPTEGKAAEKYNEIVVDKAFMIALDRECSLGASIALNVDGVTEEFTVSGYTDDKYTHLTHPVRVSKEFAEQSSAMKDYPYTALVRLNKVSDMPISVFTTAVYQMAADYGIDRQSVNTNGKFETALQDGDSGLYMVLLVSLVLFIASGLVIYSIFYLSVSSRVQQIGQFQTIGMTEKQVKKMIRREGLMLGVLAIPTGLLMGGIFSYLVVPDGWSFKNYGVVIVAVSIFGFLIVQLSVSKPASIASKISPIDASKNTFADGDGKTGSKEHKMLTPFTLARSESNNNRKKWLLTTVSLALGGILFMIASTWIASWDEELFARGELFTDGEYFISYKYDHNNPDTYGVTNMQLTGDLGENLEEEIRNIPYVKDIHIEEMATGVIEYQGATFTQSFYPLTREDSEYYQLPAKGNNSYEYMAENDAILITDSTFSQKLNGITFQPGDKITLRYFDGEEHSIDLEIGAVSTEKDTQGVMRSNFCMPDKTMRKLWETMDTAGSFSVSIDDYEKNGDQVEEEINALLNRYDDLNMSTLREEKLVVAREMKEKKIQIYGISIFIILFSIFNLINTVIGSITSRKKQLSMLESIGMEERQIRSMLIGESFLLALPNMLITLTLGTAIGFGVISFMHKSATYLVYQFPVFSVVLYTLSMIGIPMIISLFCLKGQNKVSLVERIREEQ